MHVWNDTDLTGNQQVAYASSRDPTSTRSARGVVIAPASATPPKPDDADAVFRALAHPVRRALLDLLAQRDGRTLKELAEAFDMTRQGCSKHLAVLEEAHVVVVRSVGKERHHYLNADPIQRMYDRWVSRFARPWAHMVADVRRRAETTPEARMHHPELVIETFVETTPERLWQALVDPDDTERYYFGGRFEGDVAAGSPYRYLGPDGSVLISGTIVSADPPRELVMTFLPGWAPESATRPSRATFTIEARGSVCRLTVVHDGISADDTLADTYRSGWSQVLAGLKTLLETGRPLAPVG